MYNLIVNVLQQHSLFNRRQVTLSNPSEIGFLPVGLVIILTKRRNECSSWEKTARFMLVQPLAAKSRKPRKRQGKFSLSRLLPHTMQADSPCCRPA